MNIRKIVRLACFALVFLPVTFPAGAEDFTNAIRVSAEPVFPGVDWEYKTNGFSPEIVREADAYVHTLDTTALMVVKNGRVAYQYGDVKRLSYLASARKSVLSMLYGSYVATGKIHLNATLKDLGMSDVGGLLPIEERAKVIDLITARSGVYHPAANAGDLLLIAPKRGSKEPGTYWLYSNWDFNAAGAVFERMTGKNIYDALRDDLANPIGMQDFDRERQQKSGDVTRSQYAAYHLVLSTRDMARLGLLMLRQGQWRDRRSFLLNGCAAVPVSELPWPKCNPRMPALVILVTVICGGSGTVRLRPAHTRVPTWPGCLRPIHYHPAGAGYGRRAQNLARREREPERVSSPA